MACKSTENTHQLVNHQVIRDFGMASRAHRAPVEIVLESFNSTALTVTLVNSILVLDSL